MPLRSASAVAFAEKRSDKLASAPACLRKALTRARVAIAGDAICDLLADLARAPDHNAHSVTAGPFAIAMCEIEVDFSCFRGLLHSRKLERSCS